MPTLNDLLVIHFYVSGQGTACGVPAVHFSNRSYRPELATCRQCREALAGQEKKEVR